MSLLSFWLPKRLYIGVSLLLLLALILTACSPGISIFPTTGQGNSKQKTGTGNSTPATGGNSSTQPCPDAVKDPSHWDPIIPTKPGTTQVGLVSCAYLIGNSSLQALINVYHQGTGQILDAYVYTNITDANPSQIFKLEGLYKGDARISTNNTLITNEVDGGSSVNKGKANAVLMRDLSREFTWSKSAGTFIQVAFPGIFPDLTHYQAEADQKYVNQGYQSWKRNASMTAQACAEYFLKWFPNPPVTVQSGGGSQNTKAVVLVKSPDPGNNTITVSLSRLEGNTNGGIWEVTSVQTGSMSITSPRDGDLLNKSVSVQGTGHPSNAFNGEQGFATITVLDHLYDNIGYDYVFAEADNSTPNEQATLNGSASYTSSFTTGAQEGVVAIYLHSYTSESLAGGVLVKVLLGPTLGGG